MTAIEDIAAERHRQIEAEGWTRTHDDEHNHGEMARAASAYALAGSWPTSEEDRSLARDMEQSYGADSRTGRDNPLMAISVLWPWDVKWWKPSDRRRNLVKAGALIVAEIERLDRAASKQAA